MPALSSRSDDPYREFVGCHASLAYALAWLRCGDFDQARQRAELALRHGRTRWQGWHRVKLARDLLAEMLDERPGPAPAVAASDTGEASFQALSKLRRIHAAYRTLASFDDDGRLALFLLYVEEVDQSRVSEWLGRRPEELDDLRQLLRQRVADETDQREAPLHTFARTLGRHRLPADFTERVLGSEDAADASQLLTALTVVGVGTGTALGVVTLGPWILAAPALGALLVAGMACTRRRRQP